MKITPADREFGYYIKERADWSCERCGVKYGRGAGRALQLAHFIGRKNSAVRHDPQNGDALCSGCHRYFHSNPHLHTAWKLAQLGPGEYDKLVSRSNDIDLGRKNHREQADITAYFRTLRLALEKARDSNGVVGRMD